MPPLPAASLEGTCSAPAPQPHLKGISQMPLAKLHVLEGQYDETRLAKASAAIQSALIEILGIPPDDFFQIHHVLPRNRYLHTPAFLGLKYSDDMILLELTFIAGRPKETRLALLRSLNEKVVAAAGISPDDLVVMVYEIAGENASFGRGLAQRAHIAAQS
jgi:hypothetical protein